MGHFGTSTLRHFESLSVLSVLSSLRVVSVFSVVSLLGVKKNIRSRLTAAGFGAILEYFFNSNCVV